MTPCLLRTNKASPMWRSSSWIDFVTAGCVIASSREAATIDPASATFSNTAS